jgi:hypothetical protein
MPGVMLNGFEKPTEGETLAQIKADLWANISDQLNLSSAAPLGQIVGIFNERLAELWDLAEAVYNARIRGSSTGAALTALSLLTGTQRKAASKTEVTVTVNIDDGFSQAAGTMFAHVDGDPTARFTNVDLVENTSGITDDFDVEFEAETAGELAVTAATLTVIAEPISGWNSITNALDGDTGDDDESDAALRLRGEEELQAQGSTTVDAIRDGIMDETTGLADNITHCVVHENDSDETDAEGRPAHSIEVVARGLDTGASESTRLAEKIFELKAGGIEAYGTADETVTDTQGNDHTIAYTWVDEIEIYFEVDIVIDEDLYPLDGDDQIKEAIVAVEDTYGPGSDIIAERIKAACFTVAGVVDVDALRLGTTISPVGTANLTIGVREIGVLDTSRIEVAQV